MTRTHRIITCLAFFVLMTVNGCVSSNPDFNQFSIPKKSYLVGGGFNIQYTAPCSGVAYWVEESTHKILETQSLKAHEKCEFSGQPDTISSALGIDKTEIKLTLYFIPDFNPDSGPKL